MSPRSCHLGFHLVPEAGRSRGTQGLDLLCCLQGLCALLRVAELQRKWLVLGVAQSDLQCDFGEITLALQTLFLGSPGWTVNDG